MLWRIAACGVVCPVGNVGCYERRLSGTAINSAAVAVSNGVWPLRLAKEAGNHGKFGESWVGDCCTSSHSCGNVSYCPKCSGSGKRPALMQGRCMTGTLATDGHRLGSLY